MVTDALRSFGEWLHSATKEEVLEALREVDAELALAQQEADAELAQQCGDEDLCFEVCKPEAPTNINVPPPSGFSTKFSDVLIEAA